MRSSFLLILILVNFCGRSYADDWFEEQTPLTQAHKKLLDDDLPGSFSAMVQVWQTENAPHIKEHLNQLLIKSLDKDCGKSLYSEELPLWLRTILIRKQSIQSPGRRTESVVVEAVSKEAIKAIELKKWLSNKLSSDTEFALIERNKASRTIIFQQRYTMNRKLESGLYQLTVTPSDGKSWNSWIIISNTSPKQVARWETKDSWVVDKTALLNPYCPLPVLGVSLYGHVDDEYVKVWQQDYEVDYPSVIPIKNLSPNRYVLAVSMTHKRWQGQIAIEDQQVISKTYDISDE